MTQKAVKFVTENEGTFLKPGSGALMIFHETVVETLAIMNLISMHEISLL